MESVNNKMQVEIWSDLICPFCYIGKRKFEIALAQFPLNSKVEVVWRSFQISPDLVSNPNKNVNQFLAKHKGVSIQEAKKMNLLVTQMANKVGLEYYFDISIVANSFDAHRLSHFAKQYNLQKEVVEKLFAAYFTEGKNIADHNTLIQIGKDAGLNPSQLNEVLSSDQFEEEVKKDMYDAQLAGIRGVPYFLFNKKQFISGAQETKVFTAMLEKTVKEFEAVSQ